MVEKITRREFLGVVGSKTTGPLRILAMVLALAFAGWVLVLAVETLRGFTFHGWVFLGVVVLAFGLLVLVRRSACRVYAGLPARGKVLCDAVRESIGILILVGVGILAWHKLQTEETVSAVFLTLGLAVELILKGRDNYRERVAEKTDRQAHPEARFRGRRDE